MRKVALVFVLAVFLPSLLLAWLAIRSLRDQQFLIERQQSLLYQGVADSLAKSVQDKLSEDQSLFTAKVAALLQQQAPEALSKTFDDVLRKDWPLAQVGFVVSLSGQFLCPSCPAPFDRPEAQVFCADNGRFLANRESVEVYWNPKSVGNNYLANNANGVAPAQQVQAPDINAPAQSSAKSTQQPVLKDPGPQSSFQSEANNESKFNYGNKTSSRNVIPQSQGPSFQKGAPQEETQLSKVASSEGEFRQLMGDATEGTLARFVGNKLNLLLWCRAPANPNLIFGAQLALPRLLAELRPVLAEVDPALREEICVALLDDTAKPTALSQPGFRATWKRPFVATEIGEALPHWEVAVYLLDPAKLTRSAKTLELTLGLLITVLLLAIAIGSWLIVADLNRQLTLARQKTDFVSNVSHELKTPLTSIRMFSELLAEGRINDPGKQHSYLAIITAETARLTRLINNVLDFARLERGEKKYKLEPCDLVAVTRETAEIYRPHLEAAGFRFDCQFPDSTLFVNGDRDALAQIIVNLLSNAEKYSDSKKEVFLILARQTSPLPFAEIKVLDRGLGVPKGSEEKIFEQFYRAHDSLSSGIQGSGLGLTLARQIARAHGGDVVYESREGGGSCFILRLPVVPA
jgi:signal transduction histidine kinase